MTESSLFENVTCLGCGCACDDIAVVVRDSRISEARNACSLGTRWFGDGQISSICRVDRHETALDQAVSAAAVRLQEAARPLVYLAPGVSTEAQREATAIADLLGARLDSVTSAGSGQYVLAAQESGFASATLGEVRNRADVVVFWAVDLERRYPRFASRYAPDPVGIHIPLGRQSRAVVAIDVGPALATADADRRFAIEPLSELATLTALGALVRDSPEEYDRHAVPSAPAWVTASELAPILTAGRYVALVFDAEADDRAMRSRQRFAALISLAQSLNDRTRCAAIGLRAGGNRCGADSVFSAQTGFPFAVDYSHGWPRYDPHHGDILTLLNENAADVVLVVGDVAAIPADVRHAIESVRIIALGPRASGAAFGDGSVTIDTGVAGIHDGGTAFRTDDVPLPLRASLRGPPSAVDVLRVVAASLGEQRLPPVATLGDAELASR